MDSALLDLALAVARCPPGMSGAVLSPAELGCMHGLVEQGSSRPLDPDARWRWLSLGLMTARPSLFFTALRRCGALRLLWPQVEGMFGVPQLSDAQEPVDVGAHQLRVLDGLAARRAPLPARFAALVHKLGKATTSREIWPSHYKHEQRGHDALQALCAHTSVPDEARILGHLVIAECDRVHRVSPHRAGAITDLIERVGAVEHPERFAALLDVCACDYGGYEGHEPRRYPKALHLLDALEAYQSALVEGLSKEQARDARAHAVAQALNSFDFAQRTDPASTVA